MGRKAGFKMTDAHKAALKAGRMRARLEHAADKIAVSAPFKTLAIEEPIVKGKRGRKPGFKLTDEQKAKIIEGRKAARERKVADGEPLRRTKKSKVKIAADGRPIITVTGKEEDAFALLSLVRDAFRSIGNYLICPKIEREITTSVYWQNKEQLYNMLSKYVVIEAA